MTEQEYMILTNKVKVDNAISILNNLVPEKEYGIDSNELALALNSLDNIQMSLRKLLKTDEQDE